MARYTSLFTVSASIDRCRQLLMDLLSSCSFDVIYSSEDYLVAREVPGHVAFPQLVTVEVLMDRPIETEEVRMNVVVKNEELPLKNNNHCRQVYNRVHQAVTENRQWHLTQTAAS